MDHELAIEEDFLGLRKSRTAAVGKAELMKRQKHKKKRPIDKGKKQVKVSSTTSRGHSSPSF